MGLVWWLSRETCKPEEPSPIPGPTVEREKSTPQSPLTSMHVHTNNKVVYKSKKQKQVKYMKRKLLRKMAAHSPMERAQCEHGQAREAVLDFPLVLFLTQVPMKLKLASSIPCSWGWPRIPNPSASQVRGWQACATISSSSQEGWQRPGAQNWERGRQRRFHTWSVRHHQKPRRQFLKWADCFHTIF